MESAGLLALVGLLALMVLTVIADLAAKITTNRATAGATDDQVAGTSNIIEVGGALFTAEEYARLVELQATYHSTPTTGGEA